MIVLITTGDVMLGRAVNFKSYYSQNFIWPFEKTAETFKKANLTFINLESPLVENCPLTTEGMKFCADPKNIAGLKFAGIDVANLANNHANNYGSEGIKTTLSLLKNANILTTGVSGPVFKESKGNHFAFLGYNDTGAGNLMITPANKNKISQELNDTKTKADVVVVAFHWGIEYTSQPTKRQQELAHWAIDSGANLVIGHHPHWIQPVEIYKGGIILYSLGNFIFDQAWSEKTKQGIVGRFTFFENQLVDVELLPVEIDNFGQPSFMTADQKTRILEEIEQLSKVLIKRN
ncbi:MAG TPA: CapA family protein [Nevskiaceae bacterium]|nr:CapA family protein [Nevskiaceae bacterium]